jgi:hypothetical protein
MEAPQALAREAMRAFVAFDQAAQHVSRFIRAMHGSWAPWTGRSLKRPSLPYCAVAAPLPAHTG